MGREGESPEHWFRSGDTQRPPEQAGKVPRAHISERDHQKPPQPAQEEDLRGTSQAVQPPGTTQWRQVRHRIFQWYEHQEFPAAN